MNNSKQNIRFYSRFALEENQAVEVYLGQNCGKQLQDDILSAQQEVLVVSPYIDKSKLNDLLHLHRKNVSVRLAFSHLKANQYNYILQQLIGQHKETDQKTINSLKQKQMIYKLISIICLVLSLISLSLFVYEYFRLGIFNYYCLIALPILYISYFLRQKRKDVGKTTPVHSYTYFKKNIDFKYLNSYDDKFIHAKIYIIDRKIAYMGSLNFTNNGFTSNFETRIRITHKDKIKELVDFVETIFADNYNFRYHNINWLGHRVYPEHKCWKE